MQNIQYVYTCNYVCVKAVLGEIIEQLRRELSLLKKQKTSSSKKHIPIISPCNPISFHYFWWLIPYNQISSPENHSNIRSNPILFRIIHHFSWFNAIFSPCSKELLRPRGEAPGTSQRGAAVDAATQQLQLLGAAEAALEQRPSHAEGVETAVGRTTWKGKLKYTY
jgi:hypothetical protein